MENQKKIDAGAKATSSDKDNKVVKTSRVRGGSGSGGNSNNKHCRDYKVLGNCHPGLSPRKWRRELRP